MWIVDFDENGNRVRTAAVIAFDDGSSGRL